MSAPPQTLTRLRDLLALVVRIREALADGDLEFAWATAENLEDELAGLVAREEVAA